MMPDSDRNAPLSLDDLRALAPMGPGSVLLDPIAAPDPRPFGTGLPFPEGGVLRPPSVILIAGVRGMGATTVALRLAFDAARGGWEKPGEDGPTPPAEVDCFAGIRGSTLAEIAVRALGGASATTLQGLPVRFHPPCGGLATIERLIDGRCLRTGGVIVVDALDRLEPSSVDPKHARRLGERLLHLAICARSVVLVTATLAQPDLDHRPPPPLLVDLEEWRPLHEVALATLLLYRDGYFHRKPLRPRVLEVHEYGPGAVLTQHLLPWGDCGLAPLH